MVSLSYKIGYVRCLILLCFMWTGIEPGILVPQGYQGRVQYLLTICLTDMEKPDLAMTLTIMEGYYLGNTCLILEMVYLNARLLARPAAVWL